MTLDTHTYCHRLTDLLLAYLEKPELPGANKAHLEWLFTAECEFTRAGLLDWGD